MSHEKYHASCLKMIQPINARVTSVCTLALWVFLISLLQSSPVRAEQPIGKLTTLDGSASKVSVDEISMNLQINDPLFTSDTVRIEDNSNARITLRDQTELVLGANAQITLADFAYDESTQVFPPDWSTTIRHASGTFRFISGQIAEVRPKRVRVELPNATIGIRGTDFVVEIGESESSVLLLEGAIEVETLASIALLNEPPQLIELSPDGVLNEPVPATRPKIERLLRHLSESQSQDQWSNHFEASWTHILPRRRDVLRRAIIEDQSLNAITSEARAVARNMITNPERAQTVLEDIQAHLETYDPNSSDVEEKTFLTDYLQTIGLESDKVHQVMAMTLLNRHSRHLTQQYNLILIASLLMDQSNTWVQAFRSGLGGIQPTHALQCLPTEETSAGFETPHHSANSRLLLLTKKDTQSVHSLWEFSKKDALLAPIGLAEQQDSDPIRFHDRTGRLNLSLDRNTLVLNDSLSASTTYRCELLDIKIADAYAKYELDRATGFEPQL